MTDHTTLLVPIRYPLTDQSTRTLTTAKQLAHTYAPADLLVLHVNLFQSGQTTQTAEITRAITPLLNGTEVSVVTRRGFIVEEVILEEAIRTDADVIVLGKNQKTMWRRVLSRLAGNDPAVAAYLEANVDAPVNIVEVGPEPEPVLADGKG